MVNKVHLIGHAGQNPEYRTLESGARVLRLSLATSEQWQDKNGEWQEETQWHNVIAWNDLADRNADRLHKGHKIYVEGKVAYRKYTATDGTERQATDIVASKILLLEKTDRSPQNFPNDPPPQRGQYPPVASPEDPQHTKNGGDFAITIPAGSGENDLPF